VVEMTESGRDDWEDQILEEMAKMFSEMGMPIDVKLLQQMMGQIREQFEKMGIDPEKLANTEMRVDVNSDPEQLRKQMETMMNGPDGFANLFKNMGIDIKVDKEVNVVEAEAEEEDEDVLLSCDDVYVHENRMYVTIDVSRQEGLKQSELELNLSDGGTVIQLMKKTQLRPFRRFDLPQKASKIVEWSLNNGILDITFELGNE